MLNLVTSIMPLQTCLNGGFCFKRVGEELRISVAFAVPPFEAINWEVFERSLRKKLFGWETVGEHLLSLKDFNTCVFEQGTTHTALVAEMEIFRGKEVLSQNVSVQKVHVSKRYPPDSYHTSSAIAKHMGALADVFNALPDLPRQQVPFLNKNHIPRIGELWGANILFFNKLCTEKALELGSPHISFSSKKTNAEISSGAWGIFSSVNNPLSVINVRNLLQCFSGKKPCLSYEELKQIIEDIKST